MNAYQTAARALAEKFAARAGHWDKSRNYCWQNVRELCDAGLMGMTIPTAYGGRGASLHDVVLVVEEIAKACTLSARIVVEANMGALSAVMAFGTGSQKRLCAHYVLAGDKPAICITEQEAGSAATDMTTTALRKRDHYVINGAKHWITGGGVSKLHLVFARVIDRSGCDLGIGAFLLLRDPERGIEPEGFRVTGQEHTMGLCGMPEARLRFDDVKVDHSMALIAPSGLRHGFGDLMMAYNAQRIGAAAAALGVSAGALNRAKAYLTERHQFGRPLAEFQGLQWMLADMDTKLHAARLLIHEAAQSTHERDERFPDPTMAARAKLFASEAAIEIVNNSMQMLGARGYSDQEPLERMYRDVRMFTIGGGTAQILRTQIAGSILDIKTPQRRHAHYEPYQIAAE
ncbi:MAG: acyl-CoA dehydrogenase family protein [Ahrensia sp.]|nr:acyl-CoA dehydrogenase family protein [Ahrensia sp.]